MEISPTVSDHHYRQLAGDLETIREESESAAITSYRVKTPRIWSGRTAFQAVEIADSPDYGRLLFLDGELQSATSDEHIYHESLVHPAMCGAGTGARVLVVGGGEGATVREVLRWSPVEVIWVDIDAELVSLCREHLDWPGTREAMDDSRVTFLGEDIATALPRLGQFDVIILDLPDPDGETGWLYSAEFFAALRSHLAPERGILVTHCGPVRPLKDRIGAGFDRIWTGAELPGLRVEGFYAVGIPSFQGDWGFWLYRVDGDNPFDPAHLVLPPGVASQLCAVDETLLQSWAQKPRLWAAPLAAV